VRGVSFIEVMAPGPLDRVRALGLRLDRGGSEALALALEVGAETVLIDEAVGRSAARKLGLAPLGVIGVLVEAKQDGLIGRVGPLVDRLRDEIKFFVSDALRDEAFRLAGELEGGPDRE
jgi:predicted nucleic acid-binding protein